MTVAASRLRVEHRDDALGLLVWQPRLSWRLPTGAREQRAYRITSDNGWDSDWVESGRSLLVPYAGPPLTSSQRVEWRVQVRTDLGVAPPSEPSWFETGLLRAEDWRASWIEPAVMPDGLKGERAAALLRFDFEVGRPVVSARLHATAQGIYEAFVNGARVGDAELTPGWTQYDARLQVQTHDLTGAVREGDNALGVVLADGWFRGQTGITRSADQWGTRVALLAQLHLVHDDGSVTVVGTGPGWRSSVGHVVAADLIAGERWDLTRRQQGWDAPGFDDTSWDAVTVVQHGYAGLVDSPAPPVRRVQQLVPVSVTRLAPGRHVVDLGQNINGWVRLTDLGPAGTTLTLTHGEWLDGDGDVTTDHLRPAVPFLPEPLPAGQVDAVVSAGLPGGVFEPRRTTHGFQYVRIEGHPGELGPEDVRGVVVHTDLRRTGWFCSSDGRLDRFHEAAVWSLRGNACDVPTDCPHRERAPWTGDWQLSVPTAAFLYDVAGFSTKWLRDVALDQWPDGTVANTSPSTRGEGRDSPVASLHGSAGWGDAAVLVPWELYRAYGDVDVLDELWPTMVRWLERTERLARDGRHPARAAARPDPAPHERYLVDTGFHWGEWLVPGEEITDFRAFVAADKGDVATAYFAHSARLLSRTAEVTGRADDAVRYAELADRVRAAWQAEHVDATGQLAPDTQANHVRALAFDLVPEELRPAVADRLVELVRLADTHLGTGFLATQYLLPVLADTGHLDVAYELLLQDSEPSWLVMVDRGATTVWERWDGVGADGAPHESLNHCSKGAVISFLHRYTAGIELLEPAYRRFRIRPRPGGGLTSVEAAHESPYGRIESAWRIDGDRFELRVVVPPGTSAEVVLPDGRVTTASPGEHTSTCTLPPRRPPGAVPMSDLTVLPVTVEHHREPLGIGERAPRLSWVTRTELPGWRQAAYELEIVPEDGELWSSGRVDSAESVLVAWEAPSLASRDRRALRVRVWGEGAAEPSAWSEDVVVEAGLLDPSDWTAHLARPLLPQPGSTGEPVAVLRREFVLDRPVARARLYATAQGVYEAEIDGTVVGDHVLAPGWTSYRHRLRYQTHDVTALLSEGRHAVGVTLADGWYRGYLGFAGGRQQYGDRTGAFVQLEVDHPDGTRTVVTTDGSWRSTLGAEVRADLYKGETVDFRRALDGWSTAGFDDADWTPVELGPLDVSTLVAPTGPPVRRTEVLPARELTTSPSGRTLVDFGQNLVGRIRFRLPDGPAGAQITVRHAEVLEDGELGVRPLRAADATDVIVLDGGGPRTWEPRFTFHGFRYAEVTGWPGQLRADDLEAVVVHTDLRRTGTFTCSDPDVTRLHENVVWGMRGNFVDLPTDCPQRDERLGWTGDLEAFVPTATFLYDTAGMLRSWLADLAVEQLEDLGGLVPLYVPWIQLLPFPVSAEVGWGDAAVVVPWTLYEAHGDARLLADQWPSMTAWLDAVTAAAGEELDFAGVPFMLGDWLDPAAPPDQPGAARTPWPLVATAYLARTARIMARAAEVLGHDGTAFSALAERVAERFRAEYVTANGRVAYPAQTAYALALECDLLLPEQREHAGRLLAEQVAADGWHIGSGFLGTPFVTDALVHAGATSAAYELLLQRECPSWLYPVTMGATTVWERWDSMLPDRSINPGEMTSFNHYAYGAVADWLHRTVAGLAPAAPGYRTLQVAPRPGPGITSAAATHETPYGTASVSWTVDGSSFVLELGVPANSAAEVSLPDGSEPFRVGAGRHVLERTVTVPQPVEKPQPPDFSVQE